MTLYDDIITQMRLLLPEKPSISTPFRDELCAEEGDKNAILLRSETALELGGSGKPSVSSVLFGNIENEKDEVLLFGKDLYELKDDASFAHLTLIQLKSGSEYELSYEMLKDISFSLFRLYPKGFHIRISPSSMREQVRISRAVLNTSAPLSFLNVGCSLIRLLKENENVERVKTVFITDPNIDYSALSALARNAKRISDAVHHTLELDELECASCKMKPICDEVEGLRELHFKKQKEKRHGT